MWRPPLVAQAATPMHVSFMPWSTAVYQVTQKIQIKDPNSVNEFGVHFVAVALSPWAALYAFRCIILRLISVSLRSNSLNT